MVRPKVGTKEYEKLVKDHLAEAKALCSIDYIAKRLEIGYATARAILQDLVIKGEVVMVETCNSPFYKIKVKKEVCENAPSINS